MTVKNKNNKPLFQNWAFQNSKNPQKGQDWNHYDLAAANLKYTNNTLLQIF